MTCELDISCSLAQNLDFLGKYMYFMLEFVFNKPAKVNFLYMLYSEIFPV